MAPTPQPLKPTYVPEPIICSLINYINTHPEFHLDLEAAFNKVKKMKLKEFDQFKNLNDYIKFYNDSLRWVPEENKTATALLGVLCTFYFVLDLLPAKYQTAIYPDGGWAWLSQWLVDYAQALGKWMDDPTLEASARSITEASIKTFYECKLPAPKGYHMEDYSQPLGGWKTFNEFFVRPIHAEARPICEPKNSKIIVSPADSTFLGNYPISEQDTTQFVKTKNVPWSIAELLRDTECGERFKGGQFMHAFLSPTDYHRQHAPVSGKVVVAKVIPGICYLEVIAVPDGKGGLKLETHRALTRPEPVLRYPGAPMAPSNDDEQRMEAPDSPGYQFLQARGLIVIDNEEIGLVAVMPIGMAQVSSVVLSPNVKVGTVLRKGDEISHFQFGGSDVIMLFQAKAKVDFSKTQKNKWYKVGGELARANP